MQWTIIGLNFLYAMGGLVLMLVAYKVFDWLSPRLDFEQELHNGNVAVAIFIGSIFVTIGLIISGSLK
jgi:putative membrane protein